MKARAPRGGPSRGPQRRPGRTKGGHLRPDHSWTPGSSRPDGTKNRNCTSLHQVFVVQRSKTETGLWRRPGRTPEGLRRGAQARRSAPSWCAFIVRLHEAVSTRERSPLANLDLSETLQANAASAAGAGARPTRAPRGRTLSGLLDGARSRDKGMPCPGHEPRPPCLGVWPSQSRRHPSHSTWPSGIQGSKYSTSSK